MSGIVGGMLSIPKQVGNAVVNEVRKAGSNAKDTTVSTVVDGVKFFTGVNNLENAVTFLTEKKENTTKIRNNKEVLKKVKPSTFGRITNAAGQLWIAGGKTAAWGVIGYGGYCKAAYEAGFNHEILSPAWIATKSFDGAVSALGAGANAAVWGLEQAANVATPVLKTAANIVKDNPGYTTAGIVAAGLLQSAKADFKAINKDVKLSGGGTRETTVSEKMTYGAKAVGKTVAATAAVVAAATDNLSGKLVNAGWFVGEASLGLAKSAAVWTGEAVLAAGENAESFLEENGAELVSKAVEKTTELASGAVKVIADVVTENPAIVTAGVVTAACLYSAKNDIQGMNKPVMFRGQPAQPSIASKMWSVGKAIVKIGVAGASIAGAVTYGQ